MSTRIRQELNLLMLSISFFSRLPVKKNLNYSPDKMHEAGKYVALVGWILASLLSLLYMFYSAVFPSNVAVFLLVVSSVLMTGAFHEDGLADTADGFWGGYTKERKLSIMKDSRLGTYGASALICALLGKFVLLSALAEHAFVIPALCIAYPLSRTIGISYVQDMAHVSTPHSESKSSPMAKPFRASHLSILLLTALVACLLLPFTTMLILLTICWVSRVLLKAWQNKHIDGFTGDTLGASIIINELLIYGVMLATFVGAG